MLFPMLVSGLFSLFIGLIGIPLFNRFNQEMQFDIFTKFLTPFINLFYHIYIYISVPTVALSSGDGIELITASNRVAILYEL